MFYINDKAFYDKPTSCGTCPFLFIPGKDAPSFLPSGGGTGGKCHCTMWDEWHHTWANCPHRCQKLFKAALQYPDGERLVIVAKSE